MSEARLQSWLDAYVEAWRTYDREAIAALFARGRDLRVSPVRRAAARSRRDRRELARRAGRAGELGGELPPAAVRRRPGDRDRRDPLRRRQRLLEPVRAALRRRRALHRVRGVVRPPSEGPRYGVSGPIRRPLAESWMSWARRRSRVASRLALMTQCAAVRRYQGGCESKNSAAAAFARSRCFVVRRQLRASCAARRSRSRCGRRCGARTPRGRPAARGRRRSARPCARR